MLNQFFPSLKLLAILLLFAGPIQAKDEVNNYGTSALYEAVWHEQVRKAARLLENGADPNFRTVSPQPRHLRGRTPLYAAVLVKNNELIKLLLDHGADPNIDNGNSDDLRTPLYAAIFKGDPRMVELLLETGADPGFVYQFSDGSPGTLLYAAVLKGSPRMVELLLETGADPNRFNGPADELRTPLYEAVLKESPEIVNLLLEAGADANSINDPADDSKTPLYTAVRKVNPRMVELLLEAGADPNFVYQDLDGSTRTPLAHAATHPWKNYTIARLLLEHGADPLLVLRQGKVEGTVLANVAGYRFSGLNYTRDHSDGWLHQLMLSHVDDPSRLDDTMKWQGIGCYGYVVQPEDKRLGFIAKKVYGDSERWREIARLNGISRDNPYRAGDCLKVFDVYW